MSKIKTKLIYKCSRPGCSKNKEFENHPAKAPICCGKPMKKVKDSCCEPECGPKTCG